MNYDYNECLAFITKRIGIKLFDYQKEILQAFCEDKEVRVARGIGRSYVANAFGKYVAYKYANNNYSKEPDAIFPYTCAIDNGLIKPERIEKLRKEMTPEMFEREFECK